MARSATSPKASKASKPTESTPAPTPAPVAAPAPSAAPATKSKKKETVPEQPKPVEVEVVEPAKEETQDESVVNYGTVNAALVVSLQKVVNDTKEAIKSVRSLKSLHDKEMKENKNSKKAQKRTRNSQVAGFAVATKITPELAAYIGVDSVDSLSRTEAVKKIHARIIENNLQDPEDRRIIRYENDKKLKSLLGLPEAFKVNKNGVKDTQLTYFNLQRYISNHFIKE